MTVSCFPLCFKIVTLIFITPSSKLTHTGSLCLLSLKSHTASDMSAEQEHVAPWQEHLRGGLVAQGPSRGLVTTETRARLTATSDRAGSFSPRRGGAGMWHSGNQTRSHCRPRSAKPRNVLHPGCHTPPPVSFSPREFSQEIICFT